MERKKSVEAWAPVYLVDDTDGKTPETGITYSAVTVKYAKEGATSFTTKTMASGDWQEIGDGYYRVKFSATELDTAGNFEYEVYASGTRRFPGHIDIVENLEKDTYDIVSHATYGNSAIKSAVDTKAAPADILQDPGTDKIDGSKLDKAVSALNDLSSSDVKTQADQALTDYDPPTRAEATADKQAILDDFTTIKQKTTGSYDRDTDSLEAIRDRGDAAWALTAAQVWQYATRTLTSFGTLVSDIWSAGTRTLTSFGTLIADIWSYATRTLTAGGDASETKQDEILQDLDEIKKTTAGSYDRDTDSLEAIRDRGDVAWGGSGAASEVWSYETRTLTSFGTLIADIWAYGTRTLTSFGTLVTDIWGAGTRTLTSFGTLIADIWAYATRTLTAGGDASEAKQDEILQDLDEIKKTTAGSFDRDADSLEAIRDRGDAAWALTAAQVWEYATRTLTSFGSLVSDIWSAGTRTLSSFGSLVADVWSYATRTLTAGGDASETKQDEILQDLDEIKKTTAGSFDRDTDSLEAIRDRGDAAWAGGIGEGSVTVNHNTGGTDNLRYVTSAGAGIEDAYVRAYLKADYDAGNRGAAFVKAVVRTGPDGRWVQDMKLDPATYVFEFVKQGAYGPDTKELTVTS